MEWQELASRVESIVAPLSSGEAGAGIDARYEREYDALRIEVAKLDAAAGGTIDWAHVASLASGILTGKSKDLLVASHLAFAFYKTRGLDGLTEGLLVVSEISDRFWASAFPALARIRGRASAIDWLIEKVTITLGDTPVSASDALSVVALDVATKRFASVMNERFSDPAPAIRPLIDAVTRLRMSLPADALAQAEAPPAPPEAPLAEPTPSDPSADSSGDASSDSPSDATNAEIVLPELRASSEEVASAEASSEPPSSEAAVVESAPAPEPEPEPQNDPLAELDAEVAEWLKPIRPDAPGGDDAKIDPAREAVVIEVAKLDSATGGTVDWRKVAREGGAILQHKSKDYLIASYVAYAFTVTLGVSGLSAGLAILDGTLRDYWETGFPPVQRLRARANAFGWFLDKLTIWFETLTVSASDREDIEVLALIAKRFTTNARERFAGDGPAFGPLNEAVQRLLASLPSEEAPPPPQQSSSQNSSSSDTGSQTRESGGEAPVVSAPEAPTLDGADASQIGTAVADYLRTAGRAIGDVDPVHPLGIRMRRLGAFLRIEKAPPTQGAGPKTVAAAPAQHLPQRFETLMAGDDALALLKEADTATGNTPLWFDAHHAIAVALERLNAKSAREEHVRELRRLLEVVPGIETYEFRDGRAFASPATREWLNSEVRSSGGKGGSGSGGVGIQAGQATNDALALAVGGKVPEAHEALDQAYSQARSSRERFMIRLATARVCTMEGAGDVAIGIFEDLMDEIEQRRLDEWDPELVTEALVRCHETLTARRDDATLSRDKSARVLRLLSRVDPQAAVRLSGSKKK